MTSDAGPWSDYELTNPDNRFIKKGVEQEEVKEEEPAP